MRWAADLEDDAVAAVSPDDVLDGEHLERARLGLPREPPRTHTPSASSAADDDDDDDDDDRAPRPDGRDGVESAKLLAAGGIAGAVSKTATAPLARLTILYQVQGVATAAPVGGGAAAPPPPSPIAGLSLRAALRSVAAREGVASLWRGNAVTIIHRLPYSAVNFWAYERLTEAWLAAAGDGDDGGDGGWLASARADTVRRLACGGAAGMAACALAYPLDLVRTRLAASGAAAGETRPSVGATLAAIVRREGARGLYRGLGATLAQVGPSLALNYTAYGALRSAWMAGAPPGSPPSPAASLACGAVAGLLSSTATFPLDLVRRRMQLAAASDAGGRPPSYARVVRGVMARAGPAGFYAGIVPEYVKVAPGVAIAFATYELVRDALGVPPGVAFR